MEFGGPLASGDCSAFTKFRLLTVADELDTLGIDTLLTIGGGCSG